MKKLLIFIFTLVVLTSNLYAHTSHYKDFKKIEMEILKDGKVIGYNYYFFEKVDDILIIKNQIQFKVNLFGIEVFNLEGYGVEKHKDDKLISYESKTLQNDREKFVNLIYDSKSDKFKINGSSYIGLADTKNIIGNWWNHQILQAESQISPISGSIKEQVVNFLGKEKIELYGSIIEVDHFKLTSKDMTIPKDKRLDFDVWYDREKAMIVKVAYSRLGNLEVNDPIPATPIDPPTMSITISVNSSPLAGTEGKKLTSTQIRDRLVTEAQNNVGISFSQNKNVDAFVISGRGELMLEILLTQMRREGFEMTVSPPKVLYQKDENGNRLEPIEEITFFPKLLTR